MDAQTNWAPLINKSLCSGISIVQFVFLLINCQKLRANLFVMFQISPYRARDHEKPQWVCAIEKHQQVDFVTGQILVCELHFDAKLITKRKDRNVLDRQAIPTIFPCDEPLETIVHEYEFFACLRIQVSISVSLLILFND